MTRIDDERFVVVPWEILGRRPDRNFTAEVFEFHALNNPGVKSYLLLFRIREDEDQIPKSGYVGLFHDPPLRLDLDSELAP